MAGKKTQTQLTPEEKLQQALVPTAEQPYKVPANWCWTRLGIVSIFERGITFPASGKEKEKSENNLPCIRTTNIQEELELEDLIYIDKKYIKNNENKLVKTNDIIMSSANSRELVGKVIYVHNIFEPMTFGGFVLVIRTKDIFNKFLFYFLRLEFLAGHFMGKSAQTTNIANISTANLSSYCIPLPPLLEQQRIVERIESLFAKLDEAKENLQNVLDGFETRKAAILHKAFTGELTANWRKQHGVSMDSWEEKKLGDCGSLQRGRSKHRPRNDSRLFGEKYPFIQTGDVANAEMYIINHSKMLSDFGLQQSKLFPKGTLCITIAANIGKVGILTYDCCFPDSVVGFLPNNENICEFIYYKLTTLQKELEELAPATAQKNINLKLLNDLKINMPTRDEQIEIVRIIDYLFAKEQQAKELAEKAIAKIDLIKKAILARTFRGELGTNNPADEPAVELLKRML